MCKDYIRFRLTGEAAAEQTDMSATSLINVATGRHDPAVLEAFGIAELQRLLPPLVRCDAVCGRVTAEAAAETGLAPGTPVAGGLFDIDACGLASGLLDESQLSIVVGTWGNNQYIVDPARRPRHLHDLLLRAAGTLPDARGQPHVGQ